MDDKVGEDEFARKVGIAARLSIEACKESLPVFLNTIVIPSSPEPMRFGLCADPWQRELLGPKLQAFEWLAGRNKSYAGPKRFMSILARGHDKSSLEARLVAGLLLSSQRKIHGYILAADRDQGRLIIQALEDLLGLNDWLNEYITVTRDVIKGPRGDVEVLPCDAGSNMGLRGNLYIMDEFVHWKNQKVWSALVSGFRKINPTLVVALSNAGLIGSWQHEAFLEACADPHEWCVFHRTGTLATWLDQAGIEKDRRLLPTSEGDRLYDNKWIDPASEFDYLRRSEVDACAKAGEALGLMLRVRRRVGVDNYIASIDYGPRRDRTVLVVLHLSQENSVIIDKLDIWQGSPDAPIQIADVEAWIKKTQSSFSPSAWVLDAYQMEGTIQQMQRDGLPVEAFASRAGQGNYAMAQHLRALIVEQRLLWYPGAGNLDVTDKRTGRVSVETLADELSALRVKRMPYGYRFDHENQKHDDRSVAIGMGALKACQHALAGISGAPVQLNPSKTLLPIAPDR